MSAVLSCASSTQVPAFVTCDADGVVRITNIARSQVLHSAVVDGQPVAVAAHPAGEYYGILTHVEALLVDCNINILARVPLLVSHMSGCSAIAFDPQGVFLAFGDGTHVRILDVHARSEVRVLENVHVAPVLCLAWTDGGASLVSTGPRGEVVHWSTMTWSVVNRCINPDIDTSGKIACCGSYVYMCSPTSSYIQTVRLKKSGIFLVGNNEPEHGIDDRVTCLSVSNGGKVLVAGTHMGRLMIVPLPFTGSGCVVRTVHTGAVSGIGLSDNFSYIATCGLDGELRVFDVMAPFRSTLQPAMSPDKEWALAVKSCAAFPSLALLAGSIADIPSVCRSLTLTVLAASKTSNSATSMALYPAIDAIVEFQKDEVGADQVGVGLATLYSAMTTPTTFVPGGAETLRHLEQQVERTYASCDIDTSDLPEQREHMAVPIPVRLRGDAALRELCVMVEPNSKYSVMRGIIEDALDRRVSLAFHPDGGMNGKPQELVPKTMRKFWALPDDMRFVTCTSLYPGRSLRKELSPPPSRALVSRSETPGSIANTTLNATTLTTISRASTALGTTQEKDMLSRLYAKAKAHKEDVMRKVEERHLGRAPALVTDAAKIEAVVDRLTMESATKHESVITRVRERYRPETVAELKKPLTVPSTEVQDIVHRMYHGGREWQKQHDAKCEAKRFKSNHKFEKLKGNEALAEWLEKRRKPIAAKFKLPELEPVTFPKHTSKDMEVLFEKFVRGERVQE